MSKKLKIFASFFLPTTLLFNTAVVSRVEISEQKTYIPTVINEAVTYDSIGVKKVDREQVLEDFFAKYNSPLIEHTDTFIQVADEYNLDFRLLPAISCIESSCGKRLIPESYNPFGWGIYGDKVTRFGSYDEAIAKVGEGLNKNYFSKGLDTVEKIAPVYTPPSYPHWTSKVKFFFKEMDKIQNSQGIESNLTASL